MNNNVIDCTGQRYMNGLQSGAATLPATVLSPLIIFYNFDLTVVNSPGAKETPHHQVQGMKEWWKM